MGALETNTTLIYGVHIRESANDGSDFSNGAADYRVLFLGEDGLLHVKDSAGTVTNPFSAGGISSGTSFPGSPSTGDLFHRTNLTPAIWRYDGTRWLCTCIHEHTLGMAVNISTTQDYYTAILPEGLDMYLMDLIVAMEAASGLSGTAYWRADLYAKDAGTLGSVIATANILSGTNANMIRKVTAIDALVGTAKDGFILEFAKVSTPGNLWGSGIVTYHLTAS